MALLDRLERATVWEIARRHGATSIFVFGSVARRQERADSDVDFLVSFEPGRSLFDLVALKLALEEHVGRTVDVVTLRSLPPNMAERVRLEAVSI